MTPNLDRLATEGISGLVEPVGPGITPGSGPGHLGLFGYDPLAYELGRGALSAAGLDFELLPGDVAARGNFCTLDAAGNITDRRAGRIPDPNAREVVARLQDGVHVEGAEVFFRHEREHRLLVVLRGPGLDARLADTDPQATGVPPHEAAPLDPEAKHTADLFAELQAQIRTVLADQPKANFVLLRGFDTHRELPSFADRYGLRAAAVAIYPMYRGIARAARDGRPRSPGRPRRAARRSCETPGTTTTTSSCTTSTPTRRARTATGPARSPRSRRSTPRSRN